MPDPCSCRVDVFGGGEYDEDELDGDDDGDDDGDADDDEGR